MQIQVNVAEDVKWKKDFETDNYNNHCIRGVRIE
jgi:hypothetical protein